MNKETRNRIIVGIVTVAVLAPLFAFSVIGTIGLVAGLLLVSAGLLLDWFRTQRGGKLPILPKSADVYSIKEADQSITPEATPRPEPNPAPNPVPSSVAMPVVTPPEQPAPAPQIPPASPLPGAEPRIVPLAPKSEPMPPPKPAASAKAPATYEQLLIAIQGLHRSMEEGRSLMMRRGIIFSFKGTIPNHEQLAIMLSSEQYNAYLWPRAENQTDPLVFIEQQCAGIASQLEFLESQKELVAIYNFYALLFSAEGALRNKYNEIENLLKTHQSTYSNTQLTLSILEPIESYLPAKVDILNEFKEAKANIATALSSDNSTVDECLSQSEKLFQSWVASQKEQSQHIETLLIELMHQEQVKAPKPNPF